MSSNQATIVTDLGFGDAGKGTLVDYLARQGRVSAVVRFNGGAQARHNVVTPDGRHHAFSQFGSGSFVPGVRTHLSRFMLLDPVELVQEATVLMKSGCRDPLSCLSIDAQALVVTPFHHCANVLREALRGEYPDGTCGMGIGETMAHSIAFPDEVVRVKDLRDLKRLSKKYVQIQDRFFREFQPFSRSFSGRMQQYYVNPLRDPRNAIGWAETTAQIAKTLHVVADDYLNTLAHQGNLVFEGAQGVLLDEWYGFHPHTTWSTTTFGNALQLLEEIGYEGMVKKLGVLRAYYTRHGAGPFVTEDAELSRRLPDPNNGGEGWQGAFRVGWFDAVMARYALDVCGGADSLAITNLDTFASLQERKLCGGYSFNQHELSVKEAGALEGVVSSRKELHGRVTGIRKKTALHDLAYQEMLTGILGKVTPLYETVSGDDQEYLSRLEQELGVPVSITSYGPSAAEKHIRALS